jgi:hypothetical protein
MRKYLFAAVAAGGLLLLGAAPAHADERPAPGLLGGLLDPAGGILPADGLDVDGPLGERPLVDVDPGDNTPSVVPTLPAEGSTPAARTGLGSVTDRRPAASALPAADVVDGALAQTSDRPLRTLPVADLLGEGLPLLGGLLPDGRSPALPGSVAGRESGLLGGGVPLLGGLGGLLPEEPVRTLPADAGDPDLSGMPAGGTAVPPATSPGSAPATSAPDTSAPDRSAPATSAPAATAPAATSGPGDDDQRLHEEPVDDEASDGRRFSDGRPVAGTDPDYR